MRRRALLTAIAIGLFGCTERDPDYCLTTCSDGRSCEVATHTCRGAPELGPLVDGGGDGGEGEGGSRCSGIGECANPTPICLGGLCRPCEEGDGGSGCPSAAAVCVSGSCVECGGPADCATKRQACDPASHTCGPCARGDDCATSVCLDGQCAATGSVIYVDNRGGACAGNHSGDADDPLCDLPAALPLLSAQRSVVRLAGSSAAYGAITVGAGALTLAGPGLTAQPTARVAGGNGSALVVQTNGATPTQVLVDGVELVDSGLPAVSCATLNAQNPPQLTLRRSAARRSQQGVTASGCRLFLDGAQVSNNNQGGLLLQSNVTYEIVNSIIWGNGKQGPGVAIGVGASGSFRHNTVAANMTFGSAGAVNCTAGATVEDSIFWGNTQSMGASIAGCTVVSSDLDDAVTPNGSRKLPPDFVSASDYHLAGRTAGNLACCVDQLPDTGVKHDVDGRARPQNLKWDIGAHEVP